MFLTGSERLAAEQPQWRELTVLRNKELATMRRGAEIDTSILARVMKVDRFDLESVLRALSGPESDLSEQQRVACPSCRAPHDRDRYAKELSDEGESRCSGCDEPLPRGLSPSTVFVLNVEPPPPVRKPAGNVPI